VLTTASVSKHDVVDTTLTLTQLDAATKAVLKTVAALVRALPADATADDVKAEQTRAASALAAQIYAPDSYFSTLAVTGESGCQISVDGQVIGTLPFDAPMQGLAPGPHNVSADCPEGGAHNSSVELIFGETASVDFPSVAGNMGNPDETAQLSPFVYVAGAGALIAIGGLVVTSVGFVIYSLSHLAFRGLAEEKPTVDTLYTISLVTMGAGVAVLLAGVVTGAVGGVLMATE